MDYDYSCKILQVPINKNFLILKIPIPSHDSENPLWILNTYLVKNIKLNVITVSWHQHYFLHIFDKQRGGGIWCLSWGYRWIDVKCRGVYSAIFHTGFFFSFVYCKGLVENSRGIFMRKKKGQKMLQGHLKSKKCINKKHWKIRKCSTTEKYQSGFLRNRHLYHDVSKLDMYWCLQMLGTINEWLVYNYNLETSTCVLSPHQEFYNLFFNVSLCTLPKLLVQLRSINLLCHP